MANISTSSQRLRDMLRTAMGQDLAEALSNPDVFEIMVNPDGSVRLDLAVAGRINTGAFLPPEDTERVIRLVASHMRAELSNTSPILSAELPPTGDGCGGERFEGLLPPIVEAPCFSIRKPAHRLYRLSDYVEAKVLEGWQARLLADAIRMRRNILVAGGTSSGKTTLANALLADVAERDERIILIEDTRELRCAAPDSVALRTRPGFVTMSDLVRTTLRLRPDRIIVGEVRGGEALDLLKAWNTGHPGGIATVHANSARGALLRLEQLVQEAVVSVPRPLIAEAVDMIIFLCGQDPASGGRRRVTEIVEVNGLDLNGNYEIRTLMI